MPPRRSSLSTGSKRTGSRRKSTLTEDDNLMEDTTITTTTTTTTRRGRRSSVSQSRKGAPKVSDETADDLPEESSTLEAVSRTSLRKSGRKRSLEKDAEIKKNNKERREEEGGEDSTREEEGEGEGESVVSSTLSGKKRPSSSILVDQLLEDASKEGDVIRSKIKKKKSFSHSPHRRRSLLDYLPSFSSLSDSINTAKENRRKSMNATYSRDPISNRKEALNDAKTPVASPTHKGRQSKLSSMNTNNEEGGPVGQISKSSESNKGTFVGNIFEIFLSLSELVGALFSVFFLSIWYGIKYMGRWLNQTSSSLYETIKRSFQCFFSFCNSSFQTIHKFLLDGIMIIKTWSRKKWQTLRFLLIFIVLLLLSLTLYTFLFSEFLLKIKKGKHTNSSLLWYSIPEVFSQIGGEKQHTDKLIELNQGLLPPDETNPHESFFKVYNSVIQGLDDWMENFKD